MTEYSRKVVRYLKWRYEIDEQASERILRVNPKFCVNWVNPKFCVNSICGSNRAR